MREFRTKPDFDYAAFGPFRDDAGADIRHGDKLYYAIDAGVVPTIGWATVMVIFDSRNEFSGWRAVDHTEDTPHCQRHYKDGRQKQYADEALAHRDAEEISAKARWWKRVVWCQPCGAYHIPDQCADCD